MTADPLRVRGSYLVQKKAMDTENGLRPKNHSAGERLECRDPEKETQERPEKQPYLPLQSIRLRNNAPVDPLGVRGSNLAQTKSNNAENDSG